MDRCVGSCTIDAYRFKINGCPFRSCHGQPRPGMHGASNLHLAGVHEVVAMVSRHSYAQESCAKRVSLMIIGIEYIKVAGARGHRKASRRTSQLRQ